MILVRKASTTIHPKKSDRLFQSMGPRFTTSASGPFRRELSRPAAANNQRSSSAATCGYNIMDCYGFARRCCCGMYFILAAIGSNRGRPTLPPWNARNASSLATSSVCMITFVLLALIHFVPGWPGLFLFAAAGQCFS
jgi:hypothetical protein